MQGKTAILLTALIIIGAFYYFFYVVDVPYDLVQSNLYSESKYLHELSLGIERKCVKDKTEKCKILTTKDYIEGNVKQTDDSFFQNLFNWDNNFDYTYENGNDCEGIAVFTAVLLRNLNISSVYLFGSVGNGYHVFIGAKNGDNITLINDIPLMEIVKVRKIW